MQENISYTLKELADLFQAEVIGDASMKVKRVANISQANSGDLSFIHEPQYRDWLTKTQASVLCVPQDFEKEVSIIHSENKEIHFLLHSNAKYLFAKIAQLLHPITFSYYTGIHVSAIIDPSAMIEDSVIIEPNCVVGKNTTIGANSIIKSNSVIGSEVEIGKSCVIYPNVTVYDGSKLGDEVIVHSGTVIGSDGFGFVNEKGAWIKVPQLGRALIGDKVEIGANTCIDRGALGDTIINQNVILDNLIQIAHNVQIGEGTAIAGCSAIAGSTKIGKYCLIGGGARINGHIEITDKVNLLGGTNVVQSIKEAGVYASAMNERPAQTWKRTLFRLHHLDVLQKRVKALEQINEKKMLINQKES